MSRVKGRWAFNTDKHPLDRKIGEVYDLVYYDGNGFNFENELAYMVARLHEQGSFKLDSDCVFVSCAYKGPMSEQEHRHWVYEHEDEIRRELKKLI